MKQIKKSNGTQESITKWEKTEKIVIFKIKGLMKNTKTNFKKKEQKVTS